MSADGGRARHGGLPFARPPSSGDARRGRSLLLTVALASGCANGVELDPPALDDGATGEARAVFAGHRLGEGRERVAAAFAERSRYAAPRCTFARLAPVDGARRAFPLERCEHAVATGAPDRPTLLGREVAAFVVHYVDDRLARIDVRLAPSGVAGDGAQAADGRAGDDELAVRLERRFGAAEIADAGERRWALGDDVVVLTGVDAARLSALDGRALALLPALDATDPTAAPAGE